MPDTVPVIFEVGPETAAALEDPAVRARVERLIERTARPDRAERLFETIRASKVEAHRRGLTDEIIDEELAAYNAERREAPPAA